MRYMQKIYLSPEQLLQDSFALAKQIIESEYDPTFVLGIWRGGAPIAIAIHEALVACGIKCNHDAVKISSYENINKRNPDILINDITYLIEQISKSERLLIVDDVHDTGLSMQALISKITAETNVTDIRIAVPYFKPSKSLVDFQPDFIIHETDDWLIFPHELTGLDANELKNQKQSIENIQTLILSKKS